MEAFLYLYIGMNDFKFKNPAIFSKTKKRGRSDSLKLVLISSLFVCVSFFSLKLFQLFSLNSKNEVYVQRNIDHFQPSRTVPLLINLKGQKGPQLAKVFVYITTEEEKQKDLLYENKKLEKQLIFLLSGQPIKNLKKEDFYNQIQSQLNAFLSENLINEIYIQTELLN